MNGCASAPAAAADLFERHRLEVYRWAVRLLGRHDDALDVTQDVGVRWLLQCRRQLPENPRGWLRRATLNRATDGLRTRYVRQEAQRARRLRPPVTEATDESLEHAELRQRVGQALATLSTMQREVLVAKLWDALTFAQIARELAIATPTAKTHYVRALAAIRDQLGDEFQDAMR